MAFIQEQQQQQQQQPTYIRAAIAPPEHSEYILHRYFEPLFTFLWQVLFRKLNWGEKYFIQLQK